MRYLLVLPACSDACAYMCVYPYVRVHARARTHTHTHTHTHTESWCFSLSCLVLKQSSFSGLLPLIGGGWGTAWHCMFPKHLGRVYYNANSLPNKGSGAQGWTQKAVLWKKKKTCPSDSDAPQLSKPDWPTGWSKMTGGGSGRRAVIKGCESPKTTELCCPQPPSLQHSPVHSLHGMGGLVCPRHTPHCSLLFFRLRLNTAGSSLPHQKARSHSSFPPAPCPPWGRAQVSRTLHPVGFLATSTFSVTRGAPHLCRP